MGFSDVENVKSVILRHFADVNAARDAIDRYFYREGFTGPMFDRLADASAPHCFTSNDIVAVSMLAVNVPAHVAVWLLLGDGKNQTHELLRQIPSDVDIWDAANHISPDSPLWRLWLLMASQKDVGTTICSKLLAAKRPRLVPIQDRIVNRLFEAHDDFWKAMAYTLAKSEDRLLIADATDNAPAHISLLRRIDIVLWMMNREVKSPIQDQQVV